MGRHRRKAPLLVRRSVFLDLLRRYQELEYHYRLLAGDRDALAERPPAAEPSRHVPSWAETQEIPVITTAGLDVEKAAALLRRWEMAGSPAGSWTAPRGTTG
jgi:hypothetical protein